MILFEIDINREPSSMTVLLPLLFYFIYLFLQRRADFLISAGPARDDPETSQRERLWMFIAENISCDPGLT